MEADAISTLNKSHKATKIKMKYCSRPKSSQQRGKTSRQNAYMGREKDLCEYCAAILAVAAAAASLAVMTVAIE